MSGIETVLNELRASAKTEREKVTDVEELVVIYVRHDPYWRGLFEWVEPYGEWAARRQTSGIDTGIDLVATYPGGESFAANQCKFYAPSHIVQKADIDSFFTASGKSWFSRRIIVTTTDKWGPHAEAALSDQSPPVTRLELTALEESRIDWSRFVDRCASGQEPTPTPSQAATAASHERWLSCRCTARSANLWVGDRRRPKAAAGGAGVGRVQNETTGRSVERRRGAAVM
jgi:predicted helicase